MNKTITGNQKHMTLDDRITIEKGLEQNLSFRSIATKECPIHARRDCLGKIDCSGIEADDYA